ncbi:MAG: M13 family metallopeptidase [Terricaulis sp.]|nr:M13 family metallopeptidase [Terricaulis sp.]
MVQLTRRAMGVSSIALLAGCATGAAQSTSAPAPRPPAAIGAFGVDLTGRDLSVAPGDDFYRYANGGWVDRTEIPADRSRWGTFDILRDKADQDARAIIDELAASSGAPGTNAQKIGDYYNAYLDQDAIDAAGLAPIQGEIDQVNALRTHEEAIRLIVTPGISLNSPIAAYVSLDQRNPDRYCVTITHGGLGLPEREYYRRTDGQFPAIREAYQAHVERMLGFAGQTNRAQSARGGAIGNTHRRAALARGRSARA